MMYVFTILPLFLTFCKRCEFANEKQKITLPSRGYDSVMVGVSLLSEEEET